jgi:UDP-N-acetylmuramate--alanine ligase
MNFLQTKKIHFIGIGGIGVSALARLFRALGAEVSGSDRADFDGAKDLEKRGIKIYIKHAAENVPANIEAVVYSSAIPEDNPELVFAKEKGVLLFDYVEALAKIMDAKYGVAVSGTNGKTTTTAILGKILEKEGFDPLVVVGGKVPGWDNNLRVPDSFAPPVAPKPAEFGEEKPAPTQASGEAMEKFPHNIFVAEACEYRRNMLKLRPKMIVLTNLEAEHLDYFKDLNDLKGAFGEYVKNLPSDGILVYNADDPSFAELAEKTNARKVSFSVNGRADVTAYGVTHGNGGQVFRLRFEEAELGVFTLPIPGLFNVYNALAATACALALGVNETSIRPALLEFTGTWRRFEKIGMFRNKLVISDYAHHPTSVQGTIQAAKEMYPDKKIFVVFQPHQKDRTLKMLSDFASALSSADGLLLSEIYEVAGRNDAPKEVSSHDLVSAVEKMQGNLAVGYARDIIQTERIVRDIADPYDIILIMGAGDIYKVAENLVKK